MYTRLITTTLAIISVICLSHSLAQTALAADQAQTGSAYQIGAIKTEMGSDNLTLLLIGDSAPAYTVSERFDPYRLVVDIAEAQFNSEINLDQILPENDIAKLHLSILKDQQPAIARLEFALGEDSTYDVQRVLNNLRIEITAPAAAVETAAAPAEAQDDPVDDSLFETPTAGIAMVEPEARQRTEAEEMQDTFSFSGYQSERISVDFYKIDIHNVFRLFREISDRNIIVDEAVSGSITIALNDVPWEFALDVVLNLAGLKKEERFNTIVIYPTNKEFVWPERAVDNLSFEADTAMVQQEALIIQESASQPVEIMQAKELLVKARGFERKEDYEQAAIQYEKAFELWPDNAKIAVKLANLYLGRLGMNAKALHFARQALKKEPDNTRAALYAAISSANMDRLPEAIDFFSQSISDEPPMEEALLSYAAFTENNDQEEVALKLLDTYSQHYGDNLHSMVSKARILDNMGAYQKATEQYKALLSAGFQMRPDLKEYVERRLAEAAR